MRTPLVAGLSILALLLSAPADAQQRDAQRAGKPGELVAPAGKTLYRIAIAALNDPNAAPSDPAARVEKATTQPADGVRFDSDRAGAAPLAGGVCAQV